MMVETELIEALLTVWASRHELSCISIIKNEKEPFIWSARVLFPDGNYSRIRDSLRSSVRIGSAQRT